MARTKKIIGLLLTMAILLTMIVIPASVNAATTEKTTDYQLADNVQDGVILHAWNWSYNTIKDNLQSIAQAGYTTIQTSPVQQPKIDQLSWWDVGGQWWKLYQPLSFSIAKTSWLGTKEELKSLCDEAHKYGIKIICDIVSNHMANDTEGTAGTYYDQIANFEPEIYNNTTEYFHQFKGMTSDSTIQNTVQGSLDGVPDLNTGSEYVQQRVISLLKECVDSGVDGFRFDAAKHIETPDDGAYASNYWPNVLGAATDYAKSTQSKDLYYYGEILNGVGTGRNISSYTKYMSVTDNESGNATRSYINSGSATNAASVAYKKAAPANKLVVWAESHDTYSASSLSSAGVSNENIVKTWALEASRLDATALYFARPGSALMGQVGDTTWKSITVSEINKFHNAFVGQSEKVSSSGTIAYVERGTSGVVLVNAGGYAKSVSVPATQMAAGTYTDAITGNTFTVSDGKITGDIGATGVAVVYNTTTSPYATVSSENGIFKGESLNVTINLVNATDGTYQINNGTPVSFTNSATVEVGKDAAYGSVVELKVTASNGTKTYENTYKYTKTEASHSGVFLYFDNTYSWENVFCYVYDETTDPDNTISNASWPGEQMTYDEATGYYIYEVPKELTNAQAQVIFNNNNNKQFPSKSGFDITNKSMIFKDGKWQEYVDASALFLGDADLDLSVNIKDATVIQKYSASLVTLSSAALTTADVNADKVVTIVDATLIQKYSAGIETGYKIGEKIGNEEQPTTPATAEPTTAPTQEGNLFYIADGTGWLFESGAKIWVYNNDTKEALETVKESPTDDSSKYCYLYLPEDWTNLSFYRTDYSVSDLDITDTETVFNTWKAGNYDGSTNGYFVSDNGKGSYKNYDPNGVSEMVPQTIYFDNSKTKWTSVYIYGWGNSGLANQCIEMTKVTDTVYSFTFDNEFEAGGQCFLFVSYDVSGNNWTGKPQTVNIAGEGGKNYFTNLTGSGTKWNGSWSTYNG